MEQVHKATAVKSLSLQWLTLQASCWLLLPTKGAVARGLNIQLDSTVCDYRLFVPRQCLSLPAVVDENKLELSLVFLRLRWGRDCRIGQAGCLTQRLPDCLLHSLYRCCGCYQLSQPKAKVLKELFRRRHLNIRLTISVTISCRQRKHFFGRVGHQTCLFSKSFLRGHREACCLSLVQRSCV